MALDSRSAARASLVRKKLSSTSNQADLFQRLESAPPPPADLDIHFELLGAVTHAIRDAKARGLSRTRIVDAMNRLLPDMPDPITERQLNAWTAASKEYHHFPARYLPAFCAATDCDLPLRVLAQSLGSALIDARDLAAKQLGETQIELGRLRREAAALTRSLST